MVVHRIRETQRTANHIIGVDLEPALPFCLPHFLEGREGESGRQRRRCRNTHPFCRKNVLTQDACSAHLRVGPGTLAARPGKGHEVDSTLPWRVQDIGR